MIGQSPVFCAGPDLTLETLGNGMPKLIAADEPHPVGAERLAAAGRYLVLADHAGNAVPRALENLPNRSTAPRSASRMV